MASLNVRSMLGQLRRVPLAGMGYRPVVSARWVSQSLPRCADSSKPVPTETFTDTPVGSSTELTSEPTSESSAKPPAKPRAKSTRKSAKTSSETDPEAPVKKKRTYTKRATKSSADADANTETSLDTAPEKKKRTRSKKSAEAPSKPDASRLLAAVTPVAEQLHKTGVWDRETSRGRKKSLGDTPVAVDPRRVNIVSEQLCDDIHKWLGPSLERHHGCDILDLNPGACVWSKKLHSWLEPRRHVLMEPDAELYKPFLKDLLDKPGVELVPESGYVWRNLLNVLSTGLPDQKQHSMDDAPRRNDTLIITANLSMHPKKTFATFHSVSRMIFYQFMSGIPSRTLFHRYGLVRMLLWVDDDDRRMVLPRTLTRRHRSAFETELSCEWIRQVAGPDTEASDGYSLRDEWINIESGYNTLQSMMDQGLVMPPGRETRRYKECVADPSLLGQRLAGVRPPFMLRSYTNELEDLEKVTEGTSLDKADDKTSSRLRQLRSRDKSVQSHYGAYNELMQLRNAALDVYAAEGRSAAFAAADRAYNERFDNLKKNLRHEFNLLWDGQHVFRQSPPLMHWDRRAYEPLVTRPDEFYPNAPTSLLDIQPKAMNPIFLQHGPGTNRSGDYATALLRSLYTQTNYTFPRGMNGLWSGFGDLAPACPSLTDPTRGGSPLSDNAEAVVRTINEQQWVEVVEAWMSWPFRPSYVQLLGRLTDEFAVGSDDDDGPSAMGSGGGM